MRNKLGSLGLGFNPFKTLGKQLALAKNIIQSNKKKQFGLKPKTLQSFTLKQESIEKRATYMRPVNKYGLDTIEI